MKCPRCAQDNLSHAKFCLECGAHLENLHKGGSSPWSYAELQHALNEALEQRAAMSEILRVISSSPTDLSPVFNTILANACRLCDASLAAIWRYDGAVLIGAAHHNASPELADFIMKTPIRPGSQGPTRKAALERRIIHVADIVNEPGFSPVILQVERARTVLAVPLLREHTLIGVVTMWRRDIDPFTDQQVSLVKTFADQAVIAIENVRLFTEVQEKNRALTVAHSQVTEALERQMATSEILRVISQSPTDVQPVFDTIVRSAERLCGGLFGALVRFDGQLVHFAAQHNFSPEALAETQRIWPTAPTRSSGAGRAILERAIVQIPDIECDPEYGLQHLSHAVGHRSSIYVPMLRDGTPIGVIIVARAEPGLFSDHHIELLKTFADQAVIAIENVRLFTELQEKNHALTASLEQQTATADILRVISRSPTEVAPVFEAVVLSAARLCEAHDVAMLLVDGDDLRLAAGVGPLYMSIPRDFRIALTRESAATRAVVDRATVHIHDFMAESEEEYPVGRELARRFGHRSMLAVPLLRDGVPIGVVSAFRLEVRPFPDQQIALLQTFADQAVIAIENVRLFTELQASNRELTTALDKQTATSDILRVISQSQTDVQPVFDTIVHSAVRLLGAYAGVLTRRAGDQIVLAALTSTGDVADAVLRERYPLPLDSGAPTAQVMRERRPLNIADAQNDPEVPETQHVIARTRGYRGLAAVPLLRHDEPLGAIAVTRREAGRFTDEEIALLQTFADQAVIAIENVRLFKELEARNNDLSEALERQTATSEILRVISSSPTELQPVLDAVAENAARVCGANDAHVYRIEGNLARRVAHYGTVRILGPSDSRPLQRDTIVGRAIVEGRTIHIPDIIPLLDTEYPGSKPTAGATGSRTILVTPLLREQTAIGAILIRRLDVRPFSDKQVALLQTFADQAVIAIENVRLFTELEEKNRALTQAHAEVMETLDQQTATADVLKVISRSTFDLQPVLNALIESATRLCGADKGFIFRREGDVYCGVADYGTTPEHRDYIHRTPVTVGRGTVVGRVALERRTIHFPDILLDPEYLWTDAQRIARFRTVLGVPMLREGEPIGVFFIWREEVRPFTDKQIELATTFADQAVIAIENTRLLSELRARTDDLTRSVGQLTALGEVGRAVSSTLDLETVLRTIVSRAVQLSGLDGGVVFEYDESAEEFVQRAMTDTSLALAEARRATRIRKGEGVLGRTATTLEPVQVADIAMPGAYEGRLREVLIDSGIRAILAVPMVREGHLIGCLGVTRNRPGEFAADTIELLTTFATQSALAIQNARLFREIEQKSRELEAASRHKSEFLANMSHELRTPLNAIIGFSEVLSERMFGELNEKQDEYLKDIHASGQHLLSLINDILDLSKIEAGKMELELSDFDLPMAIDNALMLVRERAGRRSIELHTAVAERLGQVRADERKIRQVLLNLLSNAIKFTPEGGRIDVEAKLVNESIQVSVSDTGAGIAPEDQEAIFEEFRQVGTASKKVEGTGLGLALSRKFIELHGGNIWVKSELGAGSSFTFTIPVRHGE